MSGKSSEFKHCNMIGTCWCLEVSAEISISILEQAARSASPTLAFWYKSPVIMAFLLFQLMSIYCVCLWTCLFVSFVLTLGFPSQSGKIWRRPQICHISQANLVLFLVPSLWLVLPHGRSVGDGEQKQVQPATRDLYKAQIYRFVSLSVFDGMSIRLPRLNKLSQKPEGNAVL